MSKNIVIHNGLFYEGKSKEEKEVLANMLMDKKYIVHLIVPGEAHVTIYD